MKTNIEKKIDCDQRQVWAQYDNCNRWRMFPPGKILNYSDMPEKVSLFTVFDNFLGRLTNLIFKVVLLYDEQI